MIKMIKKSSFSNFFSVFTNGFVNKIFLLLSVFFSSPFFGCDHVGCCRTGDAQMVTELIRQDPGFNVNELDGSGLTLLHRACYGDSCSPVIPLLLAHPGIVVNVKNKNGCTPFYLACHFGSTSCVCEMLKDSRVKVNEPNNDGTTPLWWAAWYGNLDTIK